MLIRGGRIVAGDRVGDVRGVRDVRDGRVAATGAGLEPLAGEEVVDASSFLVVPGWGRYVPHRPRPGARG